MIIDITKEPTMPRLGAKGLEVLNLIAKQLSPDVRKAVIPQVFPAFASHVHGDVLFMYPSREWMEPDLLSCLSGPSGIGKNQLSRAVGAITQRQQQHDLLNTKRLQNWASKRSGTAGNKSKENRPKDCALYIIPEDTTHPALLLNLEACEEENRFCYHFASEIEQLDYLTGTGHRGLSHFIRKAFDTGTRMGQLRATEQGVTCNPLCRCCINMSATPGVTVSFFKRNLFDGTLGRVIFSYLGKKENRGIPRQGEYDENFQQKLDIYIDRLETSTGHFVVPQLNRLADRLALDLADATSLSDNDDLQSIGVRSIIGAWRCASLLWLMNEQQYTPAIGQMMEYFFAWDLYSKWRIFGDMLFGSADHDATEATKSGPQNMLESLPQTFSEEQLQALRQSQGKSTTGSKDQLRAWRNRKFVSYNETTGLWTKTEVYLNRKR